MLSTWHVPPWCSWPGLSILAKKFLFATAETMKTIQKLWFCKAGSADSQTEIPNMSSATSASVPWCRMLNTSAWHSITSYLSCTFATILLLALPAHPGGIFLGDFSRILHLVQRCLLIPAVSDCTLSSVQIKTIEKNPPKKLKKLIKPWIPLQLAVERIRTAMHACHLVFVSAVKHASTSFRLSFRFSSFRLSFRFYIL